jgi:hypothetical protein
MVGAADMQYIMSGSLAIDAKNSSYSVLIFIKIFYPIPEAIIKFVTCLVIHLAVKERLRLATGYDLL